MPKKKIFKWKCKLCSGKFKRDMITDVSTKSLEFLGVVCKPCLERLPMKMVRESDFVNKFVKHMDKELGKNWV